MNSVDDADTPLTGIVRFRAKMPLYTQKAHHLIRLLLFNRLGLFRYYDRSDDHEGQDHSANELILN